MGWNKWTFYHNVFVFFLLKISETFKKKSFGSEIISYALSTIIILKYLWESIDK
jgi:hypothetical protein